MTKLRHCRAQTRTLNLETLEARSCMAASITATLTAQGVLQVEGTNGNDNLVVSLASNQVSVKGVTAKFTATAIKSISINTLGGNDVVDLGGLGAGWNKAITVYNSAGSDQTVSNDKSNVFMAASATFTKAAAGAKTLNNKAVDWFDANIRDDALRSLLKSSYSDSKLSRAEMLSVFAQVKKDNVVSTSEFSDLTATANNAGLFTGVEYVGVLTKDVVLGNAANAKYQGSALGNLKANASGAQLDKLVNKWFLGADHPTANYGGTTFAYANAKGSLFAGSAKYSDVVQGAVGDCYFVATLGEIALKSPTTITSMFIVNGDGTFTVRFYNNGKADYVTVDSQLPVDQWGRLVFANMGSMASNTANVLWVALAEKAYVQMNESGWLRMGLSGNGQNSYQAIAGGWFSAVSLQVANRASSTTAVMGSTFTQFTQAFNAGKLVGFASKSSPSSTQIVGNHQYVVIGFNATAQTVTLFNPWGVNNGSRYPGLVTMNWSDLAASFSYWDRA